MSVVCCILTLSAAFRSCKFTLHAAAVAASVWLSFRSDCSACMMSLQ